MAEEKDNESIACTIAAATGISVDTALEIVKNEEKEGKHIDLVIQDSTSVKEKLG